MSTNGGRGPNGVSAADGRIREVIEALAMLEERSGRSVTAGKLLEVMDVFAHHQRRLMPHFTPRFPGAFRLFVKGVDREPADLAEAFNEALGSERFISDTMPVDLPGRLMDGFEGVAEHFETVARTQPPRIAEAASELALQLRRVVATIGTGYVGDDSLEALYETYLMMRSPDPAVRRAGVNLLNAIPWDEKGLLQFPLFMGTLVSAVSHTEHDVQWREYLQSKIRKIVEPTAVGAEVVTARAPRAAAQIAALVDDIIAEYGGVDSIPTANSLSLLLKRGNVGLARDFIRVLQLFDGKPFPKAVFALLHIAASSEELSVERALLVGDVLRLAERAAVITGGGLRNSILPLAIVHLTGSDTHPRVDENLSWLIDRLLGPAFFLSEEDRSGTSPRSYDVGGPRGSEMMDASDLELLAYHFFSNLTHHYWNVKSSAAATLLEIVPKHDLNGARIWLMSKALYHDMQRGRGFDLAKLNKYLAPLLDNDPKVQQLIDGSRLTRRGPNEDFFKAYEAMVRARSRGGPGGTSGDESSGGGASTPESPAEGRSAATSVIVGYSASPETVRWETAATPAPRWMPSVSTAWVGNFGLNAIQLGAAAAIGRPVFQSVGRGAAMGLQF